MRYRQAAQESVFCLITGGAFHEGGEMQKTMDYPDDHDSVGMNLGESTGQTVLNNRLAVYFFKMTGFG